MPNRPKSDKFSSKPPVVNNLLDPDSDAAQQFEIELQWCIQHLEEALSSNKLNSRQAEDASRSLTTLRNKNAPMVKKRQIMRASFGDYRIKMAQEEKKLNKAQEKAHFIASSPNSKSQFVRASSVLTNKLDIESSSGTYKFNFAKPEPPVERTNTDFVYESSDNSFRFNFKHDDS